MDKAHNTAWSMIGTLSILELVVMISTRSCGQSIRTARTHRSVAEGRSYRGVSMKRRAGVSRLYIAFPTESPLDPLNALARCDARAP